MLFGASGLLPRKLLDITTIGHYVSPKFQDPDALPSYQLGDGLPSDTSQPSRLGLRNPVGSVELG
jgi:hypothetical protein